MFGNGDRNKEAEKKEDEKPQEQKKTTPDEGKTFEDNTVFFCVQDCFQKGTRYRRGDEITGKKCPPYFLVKPKVPGEDKNKK